MYWSSWKFVHLDNRFDVLIINFLLQGFIPSWQILFFTQKSQKELFTFAWSLYLSYMSIKHFKHQPSHTLTTLYIYCSKHIFYIPCIQQILFVCCDLWIYIPPNTFIQDSICFICLPLVFIILMLGKNLTFWALLEMSLANSLFHLQHIYREKWNIKWNFLYYLLMPKVTNRVWGSGSIRIEKQSGTQLQGSTSVKLLWVPGH